MQNPFQKFTEGERLLLYRMIKYYNEKTLETVNELSAIANEIPNFPSQLEMASGFLKTGKDLQAKVEESMQDTLSDFGNRAIFDMLNAIS